MAPLAARGSSIKPLNELTATEIIAAIGQGQTTGEAVVRACLERIAAREPDVHAWAHLDPEAEGIKADSVSNLAITLTPGHYVLICNLPDHYKAGMRVAIDVTG